MAKTRIIVCGGRDFNDELLFNSSLDYILAGYNDIELVSGHAKGADTFAERYGERNGIPVTIFKPDWKEYGKAAGVIRKKQMLLYAKQENPVIIAFWDGKSRGTKNMLELGERTNTVCHVIRYGKADT